MHPSPKLYFYVVYIPDQDLAHCIDAIRFVANPMIKHRTHITVRGPHERPIAVDKLNRRLQGNAVTITGVDRFFGVNQWTVFLDCKATNLQAVWWKRDYGYHPHITLYDGPDPDLADAVALLAEQHPWDITFRADHLELLEPCQGQAAPRLSGYFETDLSPLIQAVSGDQLQAHDVVSLPQRDRLVLISALFSHLAGLSACASLGQALLPPPRLQHGANFL